MACIACDGTCITCLIFSFKGKRHEECPTYLGQTTVSSNLFRSCVNNDMNIHTFLLWPFTPCSIQLQELMRQLQQFQDND